MITEYDSQVAHQRKAFGCVFAFTLFALVMMAIVYSARARAHADMQNRRDAIQRELRSMTRQFRVRPISRVIRREREHGERLSREWEKLRFKVDTFRGSLPLVEALSPNAKGHIDFKVALYDARDRLQSLAIEKDVSLPDYLGMDESTAEGEEVEARIWQLASVVRLVEACIAHDIESIEDLAALPPTVYPLLEEEQSVAIEYPVRITMQCRFEALQALLVHMDSPGSFFALRECNVELLGTSSEKPLSVTLVAGAVNFRLRDADDVVILGEKEPTRE